MLSFGCSHSTAAAATSRCFIISLTKCNIISCFFFCFPFFLLIEGFGEELTTTTRGEIFDNFNFSENIVKRRISLFPQSSNPHGGERTFGHQSSGHSFVPWQSNWNSFIFSVLFIFTLHGRIPRFLAMKFYCVYDKVKYFFFTFDHLVRLSRIVLAISNGSHSFHIFTQVGLSPKNSFSLI